MSGKSVPAALATSLPGSGQRGFSMIEAVVGAAMAVLAVVALAYSFSVGRGMMDRYEVARAALGAAQRRMEILTTRPGASLIPGADSTLAFRYKGTSIGTEHWTVQWVDARVDCLGGADLDGPNDLKRVRVSVRWGSGYESDTLRLERVFPGG